MISMRAPSTDDVSAPNSASSRSASPGCSTRTSTFDARLGGHHVVGGARHCDGGRDRGGRGGIAERVDLRDQLGCGDQRVDALPRLEPGVCRAAMHHHFERAGALACGLQRAAVGAGFEHQHVAALQRHAAR